MLNPQDVISEIAYRWVTSKSARNEFLAKSVNFKQWPFLNEKELIELFETETAKHDVEYAFDIFRERAAHFCSPELKLETPHTLIIEEKKIVEKFMLEKLAHQILSTPEKGDLLLADFNKERGASVNDYSYKDLIEKTCRKFDELKTRKVKFVEIPGWPEISKTIDGLEPGRIAMLSAKSGLGKTALALQWAICLAKKYSVAFVNQEMLPEDIGARLIGESTGLTKQMIRQDQWTSEHIDALADSYQNAKSLFITDGKSLTLEQICAYARHKKASNGLDVLIIDYDQKIKLAISNGQKEWEAMLDAVETLESLAKELEIFILLLAQANESGDPKSSKRAIQPVSVNMHFFETENKEYIIELKKNRFGKQGVCIEVEYEPALNRAYEKGIWEKPEQSGGFGRKAKSLYLGF